MADLGSLATTGIQAKWNTRHGLVFQSIIDMAAAGFKFYSQRMTPLRTLVNPKKLTFGKYGAGLSGGEIVQNEFKKAGGNPSYGIYGTVTYEDNPGAGLKLRLYSRGSGELLAETISDSSGNYDFNFRVPQGYKYYVVAFDSNTVPIYNAKIRDYLDPKLI